LNMLGLVTLRGEDGKDVERSWATSFTFDILTVFPA
jgi:hypothetical protein